MVRRERREDDAKEFAFARLVQKKNSYDPELAVRFASLAQNGAVSAVPVLP